MAKPLKSILSTAVIIVPLVGAPTVALGIGGDTVDQWGHIVDCLNWLVNDPAKHASFCLPSHITPDQLASLRNNSFAASGITGESSSSSSSSASTSSVSSTLSTSSSGT